MKSKVYRHAARCLFRENPSDGIIQVIDISSKLDTYNISGVAASVWKRLNGKNSVEVIVEDITKEYDVTEKRLKKDVERFLDYLLELKLIQEIKQ